MKITILGCLLIASITATSILSAQENADQDAAAAAVEAAKLAPEHDYLKQHVGKWTTEMKLFFADPENPPTSKGSAKFTALLAGRYVQQNFKGEFAGQPFEGIGVTGYDKTKKKYVSTWIDNFETGIATMEGTYDKKTKTLTELGTSASAEGQFKMKNVMTDVGKDTFIFKMYMVLPDGTENLNIEITYRRVK